MTFFKAVRLGSSMDFKGINHSVLSAARTASVLLLSFTLFSCGTKINSLEDSSLQNVLSGIVLPLQGLLSWNARPTGPFENFFLKRAEASTCSSNSVSATFYALDPSGHRETAPIYTTHLNADAGFSIANPEVYGLDIRSGNRYDVVITGCLPGAVFSRPITDLTDQNISAGSSLVSAISDLDALKSKALVTAYPTALNSMVIQLEDLSGTSSDIGAIYTALVANSSLSAEFTSAFGFAPSALKNSAPVILSTTFPASGSEHAPMNFSVASSHWDPSYNTVTIWKKDNVQVSQSTLYSWTPDANSQGDHTFSVYVGANDGAGNIDLSKPFYSKSSVIPVANSVPPSAPTLRLAGSPSTNWVNSRSPSLEIVTGSGLANCESFSGLALTEDVVEAPASGAAYSITCTQAGVQSLSYTLTGSGDGAKTLRLWAMDSYGNISAVAAPLTLNLDTVHPTAPVISTGSGTTNTDSFALAGTCASDSATVQLKINGTTQSTVGCNSGLFSGTLTLSSDGDYTLTASAADLAGNESADSSAITGSRDTVAPSAPSVTLASADPTNSVAASLTLASCTGAVKTYVSENAAAPAPGAAGWQTCSTVAGAITATLSAGDGTKTLYVFLQDTAGNISSSSSVTDLLDQTAPTLSLTSFAGGEVLSGLVPQSIAWTSADAGSGLKANSAKIETSIDGGANWVSLADSQTTAGPYTWTPGAAVNTANFRVRVRVSDNAGNTVQASSASDLTVDSAAPSLNSSPGTLTLNGSASGAVTTTNYIQVSLAASDDLTKITKFCLRYNDAAAPGSADACWVPVDAPSPGITPALAINLVNFNYPIGFSPGSYTVYAWVMDQSGNISTLSNGGAGTAGIDSASITYTPGTPPSLSNILATNTDSPSTPPTSSELTIGTGSSVVIKWNVNIGTNPLSASPIRLYYTEDDTTYLPINGTDTSPLPNAQGAGCTIDGSHSGCYVWSGGSPTNGYFKVRVSATDSSGMTALSTSTAVNTPFLNFLAGNTDPGLGGSAATALFYPENSFIYRPDMGSLVVASDGTTYFRDRTRGILRISPTDGIQKLWIPTTGTSGGDGGPVTSATLRLPFKIALDAQDRLLIFDYNRIRRVDTSVSPNTISTIIGGGASTADGVSPLSVLISAPASDLTLSQGKSMPLLALPNGDIYFQSDHYLSTLGSGFRIRHYDASTGLVQSIVPSGTGYYDYPTTDLGTNNLNGFGVVYDPVTSVISHMEISSYNPVTGDTYNEPVNLDIHSYVSTAPHPIYPGDKHDPFRVQGMDGALYAVDRPQGKIFKFSVATNDWTLLAGTGTVGACPDGTAALTCNMDPTDAFVNRQGTLYFVDRGQIRIVDGSGKIQTLMGQSLSSGDGGNALAARFGTIYSFDKWGDKIVVSDVSEEKLREFGLGGDMQTIAGNGVIAQSNDTALAIAQGLNIYSGFIRVDPTTGDVFAEQGYNLLRLVRSSGKWSHLAGGGGTLYSAADGLPGSSISLGAYSGVLGFDGTRILITETRYSAGYLDGFFKLYDSSDGTQSSFSGYTGTPTVGYGADGTPTSASGIYINGGITPSVGPFTFDAANNRWYGTAIGQKAVRIFNLGGNLGTLYTTTLPIQSFTYALLGGHDILFYCSTSGQLRKVDVQAATDTALPMPISSLTCTGYSMVYDAVRGSLIFPYAQNGLEGIVEYLNP
jgi:hypothetical protein